MNVLVAMEHRFLRFSDGEVYTRGAVDYDFLSQYLNAFSTVHVFARVENVTELPDGAAKASGPKVIFCEIPYYKGPRQFFKVHGAIRKRVRSLVASIDAFILRVPGTIGTIVWKELFRHHIPYAIEVVGDPWGVLASGSVKTLFRPVYRHLMKKYLKQQCRYAAAASYVTEKTLQKRYPTGGWNNHFSSIYLPDESVINEKLAVEKTRRFIRKLANGEKMKLSFVGTMEQLYKGQDELLESLRICKDRGIDIELVMIGGGRFIPYLKNRARKMGISEMIVFTGQVKRGEDVFKLLDRSDVFILPSLTEGLPRAMIEAMARGLCCIGSTVGGIPELLGEGCLFPPGSPHAISDMITAMYRNPEKVSSMILNNLQKVDNYKLSSQLKRKKLFYEKTIELSAPAADLRKRGSF